MRTYQTSESPDADTERASEARRESIEGGARFSVTSHAPGRGGGGKQRAGRSILSPVAVALPKCLSSAWRPPLFSMSTSPTDWPGLNGSANVRGVPLCLRIAMGLCASEMLTVRINHFCFHPVDAQVFDTPYLFSSKLHDRPHT